VTEYKALKEYVKELRDSGAVKHDVYCNLMYMVQQLKPKPTLRCCEPSSELPDGWYFFVGKVAKSIYHIKDGKVIMPSIDTEEDQVYGPIPEAEVK
jgi:hypothetical protein